MTTKITFGSADLSRFTDSVFFFAFQNVVYKLKLLCRLIPQRMLQQRLDPIVERLKLELEQADLALREDLNRLNYYRAIVMNHLKKIEEIQTKLDSLNEDEPQQQRQEVSLENGFLQFSPFISQLLFSVQGP